ncbi:cs domain-containing protein [Chrysochromulina tobinii]|uniref:Cs domain-containing protein n=1 Tax=Chrysochromulina tobinii TaxID=1460289 RepID=A0A0M0JQ96_9EUKA|nr:cs domain-containing protein [Chrysochromulina tobinii]|eukprot:KOO28769.1 cs domain-containing protein [Chrysochromulina sp. CCMP291]
MLDDGFAFDDEASIVAWAEGPGSDVQHDGATVCAALRRGWQSAARALVRTATDAGRTRIRHFAEFRRRETTSVVQLLQSTVHTADATIVPAVQWAQNGSTVAVMVRFSPKKHGPVSVSVVDKPEVSLTASHLSFTGEGNSVNGGKRLRFALELPFTHDIVPEASTFNPSGTGGRVTLHLAKAKTNEHWATLARAITASDGSDGHKPRRVGPISSWFEMQMQFEEEARAREVTAKEAAAEATEELSQQAEARASKKAKRGGAGSKDRSKDRSMDPSAAASTVEVIRAMEAKLKRATEGKQPGTGNRKSKWLGRVLEVFTAGSLQRRIPKQLTEMISNESSFAAVVAFAIAFLCTMATAFVSALVKRAQATSRRSAGAKDC